MLRNCNLYCKNYCRREDRIHRQYILLNLTLLFLLLLILQYLLLNFGFVCTLPFSTTAINIEVTYICIVKQFEKWHWKWKHFEIGKIQKNWNKTFYIPAPHLCLPFSLSQGSIWTEMTGYCVLFIWLFIGHTNIHFLCPPP